MWDALGSEALQAGRDLVIAGLVYLAYKIARDATQKAGRIPVMLKGGCFVLALAALVAVMLGQPSCNSGDPLFGGCAEQAGGGYAASNAARAGAFLFWSLLFGVPVVLGAMQARVDPLKPWGRPDRSRL
jgi:hypothetical protein